jgi:hypothetical protein
MNQAFLTRLPRIGSCLAALALVVAAPYAASAATMTFTAPSITGTENAGVQTFTGTVAVSDSVATDQLGGFQLDLFLSATSAGVTSGSPVTETAVNFSGFTLAQASYVYAGNSSALTDDNPGYMSNMSSNELFPSDSPNSGNGTTSLTPGLYTLAQFTVTVAGGFTGTEYFVWNVNSPSSDGNAPYWNSAADPTQLSPNLVGGSITIAPEPCSVLLMVLGAIGMFGMAWRRRRAA